MALFTLMLLMTVTFHLMYTTTIAQDQGFQPKKYGKDTKGRRAEMLNISIHLNNVFKEYDKKIRPNAGGIPVQVKVEFKVVSLGQINEASMEFTLDIFFRQWWHEPRFKHNYSEPFTMAENANKLFWIPDTYFINAKKSNFHKVTKENARIIIYPSGDVYYSVRLTLTLQCNMNLQMYPMDIQDCPLFIESYAYTSEDIIYRWTPRETQGIEIISNETAQFMLIEAKTHEIATQKISGHFSQLVATFALKRRLEYFAITVVTPTVILTILSWCCFWIVPDAIPARISLSVTTILSTLLLSGSVNAQMPKVSYMKAIDVFILGNFAFIFLSLIEYVIVLNTDPACPFKKGILAKLFRCGENKKPNKDDDDDQEAGTPMCQNGRYHDNYQTRRPTVESLDNMYMYGMNGFEWGATSFSYPKGHYIDKVSRVIFPIFYVSFINIYWFYYHMLSKERDERNSFMFKGSSPGF